MLPIDKDVWNCPLTCHLSQSVLNGSALRHLIKFDNFYIDRREFFLKEIFCTGAIGTIGFGIDNRLKRKSEILRGLRQHSRKEEFWSYLVGGCFCSDCFYEAWHCGVVAAVSKQSFEKGRHLLPPSLMSATLVIVLLVSVSIVCPTYVVHISSKIEHNLVDIIISSCIPNRLWATFPLSKTKPSDYPTARTARVLLVTTVSIPSPS